MTNAPDAASADLVSLAGFQQNAVDALSASLRKADEIAPEDIEARRAWARSAGVMLLESPTGSGKTLMLGRTLQAVRGGLGDRCVWFWFAPYSGLVAQTRDALAAQCPGLRLRDVTTDRLADSVRDGDVFVQTWASVAATRGDSKKVRRESESALSLDQMLAALRESGVRIGVVIDEAHLNFGAAAKAAADFYLTVLQPDFTLLATATPNDQKLIEFEKSAGIVVENRVVVARADVVAAGLNKLGLMMGVLRFSAEDAKLIDPEQATLTAAWMQHKAVAAGLDERGIGVAPLMLVQVEDQAAGSDDPVKRVKTKLLEIGVDEEAIAIHVSGQPDPEFHTLAHDPTKAVLIFKVAVATGFDAPRAWTLVSVRPNRGKSFGLQIVGRIMRVHPAVRPIHGKAGLLDRGYVFLTDPDIQQGLDAAVDELKAVRSSIAVIADDLGVFEFSNLSKPVLDGAHSSIPASAAPPVDDAERAARLTALIDAGLLSADMFEKSAAEQDRAVVSGEWRRAVAQTPLFGDDLPTSMSPDRKPGPFGPLRRFPLRRDRGVPPVLLREVLPEAHELDGTIVEGVARALFRQSSTPFDMLNIVTRHATLSLTDLFLRETETSGVNVRMSSSRIAEAAQLAFAFNDSLDPRRLKAAMIAEFRRHCEYRGAAPSETDLRRALDFFAMQRPEALEDAVREAQADRKLVVESEPLSDLVIGDEAPALPARLGAYEIFPPDMNGEERAFAELLDADLSGTVTWWLRLKENTKWAVTLILPNGRRFFPDFAVGVAGRLTPDHIALVEIKDDGETGRLHADLNRQKIRSRHGDYRNVTWAFRETGERWVEAAYEPSLDRIMARAAFQVRTLVNIY